MTPHDKKLYVRALQPVLSRVRTDISAIKFPDGSRWTTEPITTHAMERHVNGGPARGACPIKEGESVTMLAVLDMDSHKGETSWEAMVLTAMRVRDALGLWGLNPVAFRSSGGRGIHLLILWEQAQDAYSVRQAITAAMAVAGFDNGAKGVSRGQIEIFPKQDEVGVGENGNQFILPMAGASEPLDLEFGFPMGREAVWSLEWPMSAPVPLLARPERPASSGEHDEPIERVREALFSIPNDGISQRTPDYDQWFKLVCAVHAATGGSEEGRAAVLEWSELNPLHDEKFFEDRVWAYLKDPTKRSNAIGKGTLYQIAEQGGWSKASPDGFTDVRDVAVIDEPAADMAVEADGDEEFESPPFVRTDKGVILPLIGNVLMALRRPDVCKWTIAHDTFRDEIMISTNGGVGWRGFKDADYTRLREYLGKNNFEPIGKEMMRDAVELVAQEKAFDSAMLWINSLPKNEGGRCETYLSTYMGCEDTPYTRAVSLYMWTAMAGRVLSPGCQADMAPVFIGEQGLRKTTAVKVLAPAIDFYVEVGFHEKEDDLARKMRGRLVGEVAEMTGMRKKEIEALKAFMTRTHENWIPKFKEFGALFARRLLFIGTTNQEKFLVDDTGNRRWLPVNVGRADIDAIKRDVLLLWAEARELFLAGGVQYEAAERLAREVHAEHEIQDPWIPRIESWLEGTDLDDSSISERSYLTTNMILAEAMQLDIARTTKGDEMRAASVLKKMGWHRKSVRVGNKTVWGFVSTLFPPTNAEVETKIPF